MCVLSSKAVTVNPGYMFFLRFLSDMHRFIWAFLGSTHFTISVAPANRKKSVWRRTTKGKMGGIENGIIEQQGEKRWW